MSPKSSDFRKPLGGAIKSQFSLKSLISRQNRAHYSFIDFRAFSQYLPDLPHISLYLPENRAYLTHISHFRAKMSDILHVHFKKHYFVIKIEMANI